MHELSQARHCCTPWTHSMVCLPMCTKNIAAMANFSQFFVHARLQHALAFEAAALAHLSNDEEDLPSTADGAGDTSGCSDSSSSSPRAFVASRLRLVRSVWAADIKMHGDSQAR
eukprot:402046-Pelagomonas_calceolata.AAC.2